PFPFPFPLPAPFPFPLPAPFPFPLPAPFPFPLPAPFPFPLPLPLSLPEPLPFPLPEPLASSPSSSDPSSASSASAPEPARSPPADSVPRPEGSASVVATASNSSEVSRPTAATAAQQIKAMRTRSIEYSTKAAPRSGRRRVPKSVKFMTGDIGGAARPRIGHETRRRRRGCLPLGDSTADVDHHAFQGDANHVVEGGLTLVGCGLGAVQDVIGHGQDRERAGLLLRRHAVEPGGFHLDGQD